MKYQIKLKCECCGKTVVREGDTFISTEICSVCKTKLARSRYRIANYQETTILRATFQYRICAYCCKPFMSQRSGRRHVAGWERVWSSFCSISCGQKSRQRTNPTAKKPPSVEFTCKNCGKKHIKRTLIAEHSALKRRRKGKQIYCSVQCAAARRQETGDLKKMLAPPLPMNYEQQWSRHLTERGMTGNAAWQIVLNRANVYQANYAYQLTEKAQYLPIRECPHCHHYMIAKTANQVYCDRPECHPDRRREKLIRSRRRDKGITLVKLIERDGRQCKICGLMTNDIIGSPWKASIDHITPIAVGGTDTWDNVRVACHQCNSERGTGEGYTSNGGYRFIQKSLFS